MASLKSFEEVAPDALADESAFKNAEDWVHEGILLRPADATDGRTLVVRLGVDFGTAFTKVAIRVAQQVYFVSWEGISNAQSAHLLAGELSELNDEKIVVGKSPERIKHLRDLKLPFLEHREAEQPHLIPAVSFIAWVLRYARAWAYAHPELGPILRRRKIAWHLNIGCPAKSWEDSPTRERYRQVALSAWVLSAQKTISLVAAQQTLRSQMEPADVGLDELHVTPEFKAQIGGYVTSPQRTDGLHLLVDVGAGTLDIATFNVYRRRSSDDNLFPMFCCDVRPLGTHYLMRDRAELCGHGRSSWSDIQQMPSPQELALRWSVPEATVARADDTFGKRVRETISEVLHKTHTSRYIRAPEWKTGLPAFLSGGGAEYPLYVEALKTACGREGTSAKLVRLEASQLGISNRSLRNTPFHRMSVAFGLTLDPEIIGRIRQTSEVEDDEPARVREWPSSEDLYPDR